MTTHQEGKGLGHDTTMCGDSKMWFPMRVTYSRELKVKAELDRLGIESFMPEIKEKFVQNEKDMFYEISNNLIFMDKEK